MCNIVIEAFPSQYGESFLLNINDKYILIDGGFVETYDTHIKKKLLSLKEHGNSLSLLIVTHMDMDHIGGIIKLLQENKSSKDSEVINIEEIWFNSFFNSNVLKIDNISSTDDLNLMKDFEVILSQRIYKEESFNKAISIKQAMSLTNLIIKGGYKWNSITKGKWICLENIISNLSYQKPTYQFDSEIKITVLSPSIENIEKLDEMWLHYVRGKKDDFEFFNNETYNNAFEYWICNKIEHSKKQILQSNNTAISSRCNNIKELSLENDLHDSSIINTSSISVIIEYMNKRILFTGDSHTDVLLERMEKFYPHEEKIKFDLVKLPHHGSKHSTTSKFLKKINCKRFLISTNGKLYSHPDPTTIAKVICHSSKNNIIYFNTHNIGKNRDFISMICQEENIAKFGHAVEVLDGKPLFL